MIRTKMNKITESVRIYAVVVLDFTLTVSTKTITFKVKHWKYFSELFNELHLIA